jgi:hypothetical protein
VQSSSETPVQAAANVPEPSSLTSVESSSETPMQLATTAPESSRGASVVPLPDVPTPHTAEVSAQVAPGVDPVFLQRPGVNIRSAPSETRPFLGPPPGARNSQLQAGRGTGSRSGTPAGRAGSIPNFSRLISPYSENVAVEWALGDHSDRAARNGYERDARSHCGPAIPDIDMTKPAAPPARRLG